MLQGLTIISNNGKMLRPYVVNKVVSSNGKIVLENKKSESKTVVNEKTIEKIKELMRSVLAEGGTGTAYSIDGYDLIGKTGTASIFEKGKYLEGDGKYIYSFAGLYPGDNPEIIIYMAVKKPQDSQNYIAPAIKEVVVNTSKYLSIEEKVKTISKIMVDDYSNKVTTEVKKELENQGIRVITLGNGNKIINQYPNKGINVYKGDLVVLLTNKYDNTMIDFKGLSYKETIEILKLMNVNYELNGYGYVVNQNIDVGTKIEDKIIIELRGLY